jgi:2-polyprenyl-3-methyl-5-hydroxy-6-metoxy-1,4-benzoquinol methylase
MGNKFGSEKEHLTTGIRGLSYKLLGETHLGAVARADILFKTLKQILPPTSQSGDHVILDAGCGKGAFSFQLAREYPTYEVFGFDLDNEVVENNERVSRSIGVGNTTFFQADITELNHDKSFSVIISVDVFEHIKEDGKAFKNLFDLLSPEGHLLIHVPKKDATHIFPNAGGDPVLSLDQKDDFRIYHERQGYQIDELAEKLRQAGFKRIEIIQTTTLNVIVYMFPFPVLRLMIFIDSRLKVSNGLGLLAIAKKS